MGLVGGKEGIEAIGAAIADHGHVGIACRPGVAQQRSALLFIHGHQLIPQPVEGVAQGPPPALMPGTAAATAAVVLPAIDPMGATPGGHGLEFSLPGGRVGRQVVGIVGHRPALARKFFGHSVG